MMPMLINGIAAQTNAAGPLALPRSCAQGATMPDTARLILALVAYASDSAHAITADLEAQAVADNYRPPTGLTFPWWPLAWDPGEEAALLGTGVPLPGFHGELALRLDHTGHLREAAMTEPMAAPELNRSLLEAAWRTDSLGGYVPLGPADSTLVVRVRVAASPHPTARERALARLTVPFLRITTPVRVQHSPAPRFPNGAREEGFATFEYFVAENGRADTASLQLVAAKNGAFIAPAREAILRSEYIPAKSGACPVRVLVGQRILFRLTKGPVTSPAGEDPAGQTPWMPGSRPQP